MGSEVGKKSPNVGGKKDVLDGYTDVRKSLHRLYIPSTCMALCAVVFCSEALLPASCVTMSSLCASVNMTNSASLVMSCYGVGRQDICSGRDRSISSRGVILVSQLAFAQVVDGGPFYAKARWAEISIHFDGYIATPKRGWLDVWHKICTQK